MFRRDINTKTIINTDDSYYKKILESRNHLKENARLKQELDNVKDELVLIKNAISKLFEEKAEGLNG